MSKVAGKNVIGYIFADGMYKPVVCATGISITMATGVLETCETDNGGYETIVVTKHAILASIQGIVSLQAVNSFAYPDLRTIQKNRLPVLFRYERTDSDANVYADEIEMFVVETSDEGSISGMNTFSASLRGKSGITVIYTPTPINTGGKVIDFNYIATGGETFFEDAALIGRDVVGAFKSQNYRVITSGTPLNQETKYTSASGLFEFPIPFEAGEHILIQYQEI